VAGNRGQFYVYVRTQLPTLLVLETLQRAWSDTPVIPFTFSIMLVQVFEFDIMYNFSMYSRSAGSLKPTPRRLPLYRVD
jgi:hypothetical protein